ncbi:MAG: hypothetical protein EDX89_16530 [Acidobacteria bacterium]|nr:MAG: hypothetical protein EDX89_16530 [Acidobacteriota bacterium]MCE7957227.1 hypothetical protein [Acidobacteria bacterium ACB2]
MTNRSARRSVAGIALAALLVTPLLARPALAVGSCVGFLIPPDVPVYAKPSGDKPFPRRPAGWVQALPDGGYSMSLGSSLRIDSNPNSRRNAACDPSDFEEENLMIRLWLAPERLDKSLLGWVTRDSLVQFRFSYPGAWASQDVARNITAFQEAARKKLAEIEAEKARTAAAPPAAGSATPPAKPLSRADMERLIEAKVDPDLVEAMIRRSCISFDLDAATLADLSARVPKNVLKAAIECGGKPATPPLPAPEAATKPAGGD